MHNPAPEVPAMGGAAVAGEPETAPEPKKPWAGLPLPWFDVTRHDVAMVLRRAGVLMDACMPVAQAFTVASSAAAAPALRAAMADIAAAVGEGWTLPEALGAYPALFDDFVVAMVTMGSQGQGGFDFMLRQVADTLMAEPPTRLLQLGEGNIVLPRGERPGATVS